MLSRERAAGREKVALKGGQNRKTLLPAAR
jgi:hypothetical protein